MASRKWAISLTFVFLWWQDIFLFAPSPTPPTYLNMASWERWNLTWCHWASGWVVWCHISVRKFLVVENIAWFPSVFLILYYTFWSCPTVLEYSALVLFFFLFAFFIFQFLLTYPQPQRVFSQPIECICIFYLQWFFISLAFLLDSLNFHLSVYIIHLFLYVVYFCL